MMFKETRYEIDRLRGELKMLSDLVSELVVAAREQDALEWDNTARMWRAIPKAYKKKGGKK